MLLSCSFNDKLESICINVPKCFPKGEKEKGERFQLCGFPGSLALKQIRRKKKKCAKHTAYVFQRDYKQRGKLIPGINTLPTEGNVAASAYTNDKSEEAFPYN